MTRSAKQKKEKKVESPTAGFDDTLFITRLCILLDTLFSTWTSYWNSLGMNIFTKIASTKSYSPRKKTYNKIFKVCNKETVDNRCPLQKG